MDIGQTLASVPMGDMIRDMALAIAEAQFELDKNSIIVAEMMGGQRLLRDANGNLVDYDGDVIEPQYDTDGNPLYNEDGNLVYGEGQGPRVIDSRVYFGYTYEPLLDALGRVQYWDATTYDANGAVLTGGQKMKMVRKPRMVSMMELGFTPTFYQFVDSLIEVKVAVSVTRSTEYKWGSKTESKTESKEDIIRSVKTHSWNFNSSWGQFSGARYAQKKTGEVTRTVVQSVDASYSNKYSYTAEGASVLRTKLVPLPPPPILEERIREVMEQERDFLARAAQGAVGIYEKDKKGALVQDSTPPVTSS
ncbi:MAG: hypothetical protein H6739_14345 [Alphaproteobacteria bacterium]|nr:hypothetical protein [Alphaproteobacteria bacterium]